MSKRWLDEILLFLAKILNGRFYSSVTIERYSIDSYTAALLLAWNANNSSELLQDQFVEKLEQAVVDA